MFTPRVFFTTLTAALLFGSTAILAGAQETAAADGGSGSNHGKVDSPAPATERASFQVLQPMAPRAGQLDDPIVGRRVYYVPTMLEFTRWGRLPTATAAPALTVPSGSLVTFDTLSHEGLLKDQGRDPARFFGKHGISRNEVLDDAVAVAASDVAHDFDNDGPHVISAPVAVEGARPGDILKIEIVALTPRVPYGVNAIRHGHGASPDVFPDTPPAEPGASFEHPELFHNVSFVIPIRRDGEGWVGDFRGQSGKTIEIPLAPFLGTMGVAVDTSPEPDSTAPGPFGGNIDVKNLVVGSTLYLPAQVPGALFYVSDPHFAQGNGEVDLTAIEGSLRATVRLTVIKAGTPDAPYGGHLTGPFAETPEYWIPIGLDPDLGRAARNAISQAVDFLVKGYGLEPIDAYAYLSVGVDFNVTQMVDVTRGIHALIPKRAVAKLAPAR